VNFVNLRRDGDGEVREVMRFEEFAIGIRIALVKLKGNQGRTFSNIMPAWHDYLG
jgi:hypothetical protein